MPDHDPAPNPTGDARPADRRRSRHASRPADGFGTVRRGYNPRQVDEHLRRIEAQMMILVTDRDAAVLQATQLGRELETARAEIERLTAQLPRISAPDSIETFTERLQVIGRLARDEVTGLQADTIAHVAALISAARTDAAHYEPPLLVNGVAVNGLGATPPTTSPAADIGSAAGAPSDSDRSPCDDGERLSAGTKDDGLVAVPDPGVRTDTDRVGSGVGSGDEQLAEELRRLRRDAAAERARLHEAALDRAAQEQEQLRVALALHCRETLTQLVVLHADATRTAQQVLAQATAAAQDILAQAHGQVEQMHAVRARLTAQLRGCATMLEPAQDHTQPAPAEAAAAATATAGPAAAGPRPEPPPTRAGSPGKPPTSAQPLRPELPVTADSDPSPTPTPAGPDGS